MAINHAAQASAVQRFLLTSERFLLSQATSQQTSKQAKLCVPTCVPREFTSEWVDPFQYRIDSHVHAGLGSAHQGSMS